jgi:hypothetical protein
MAIHTTPTENRPAVAKATLTLGTYGMAEAMPFQSRESFGSL